MALLNFNGIWSPKQEKYSMSFIGFDITHIQTWQAVILTVFQAVNIMTFPPVKIKQLMPQIIVLVMVICWMDILLGEWHVVPDFKIENIPWK